MEYKMEFTPECGYFYLLEVTLVEDNLNIWEKFIIANIILIVFGTQMFSNAVLNTMPSTAVNVMYWLNLQYPNCRS